MNHLVETGGAPVPLNMAEYEGPVRREAEAQMAVDLRGVEGSDRGVAINPIVNLSLHKIQAALGAHRPVDIQAIVGEEVRRWRGEEDIDAM